MRLTNDLHNYGLVSVLLHWVMAVLIVSLFALGKYMVGLDYYDPWYLKAPDLHRSLGVAAAVLLVFRLGWRLASPRVELIGKPWERCTALWMHRLFYALIAAVVISGYLITTADGQGVPVFGWLEIPATLYALENQEEIAGAAHEWLTVTLIALAGVHSLAALKHHYIDRDATLRRMLGLGELHGPSSSTTKG